MRSVNPLHASRHKPWLLRAAAIAVLLFCLSASGSAPGALPSHAGPPVEGTPNQATATSIYPSHSERFGYGVNMDYGPPEAYDVGRLHAGWYVNWKARHNPSHPAGLDHVQVIWTYQDTYSPNAATIAAIAQADAGALWLIGNEPDCIYQGNSTPDQYARLYHELYNLIKRHDPASQVAIGGIVQGTPLRLQWLDAVLERYQALYRQPLPVDVWNIHAFLLNEERGGWGCEIPPGIQAEFGERRGVDDHDRLDLFAEQIVRFRRWMADRGERNKPLIVSEYGVLMVYNDGFDWPRVQTFMLGTFDYFMTAVDDEIGYPADGNRLVQRWAWYSLNDKRFEGYTTFSHLFDPYTKEITPLGRDFEDYVAPFYAPYVDLLPIRLSVSPAAPLVTGGQPVTVALSATIRNAGNADVENVSVHFWHTNPSAANLIGEARTIAALPARSTATVSVDWPGVGAGTHTVGVIVDRENRIVESDKANNQLSRRLLVGDRQVYLPLCLRVY